MPLHPVRFYGHDRPYGFLSNFYPAPITVDGTTWPTTEHYFQAQKTEDTVQQDVIRQAATPGEAKRLGRAIQPLRPSWDDVRDHVMLRALRSKFAQHEALAVSLLATGAAPLVEHTANDHYWGDGGDDTGHNRLGELLVRVRAEVAAGSRISPNRRIYDWLLGTGRLDLKPNDFVNRPLPAHGAPVSWERVEGMLLGLAIGDALGNTSESMPPETRRQIHSEEIRDYLPNKYAGNEQRGLPSDDSQMAFWTLNQINADGSLIVEHIAQRFCQERIFGIGSTVRAFIHDYKDRGLPWYSSGQPSAGNGAIMRIAPLLVPYVRRPSPELWVDTVLGSALTHNDSASTAACVAFVAMLWELLGRDTPPAPEWWLDRYVAVARELESGTRPYEPRAPKLDGYSGPMYDFVAAQVMNAWQNNLSTLDACEGWYSGAYLMETLPSMLYILMRHADDPEEAIVRAVNDTRDNDSVAALVGAAVGALHGIDALPALWRDGLLGRLGADDDGRLFALLDETRQRWGD